MRNNQKSIFCLLFLLFPLAQGFSSEGPVDFKDLWKELEIGEKENVIKGELVLKTRVLDRGVWPEVNLYSLVDVTPIEAVAIYADFEHQKDYVPDMVKSQVVKSLTPQTVQVAYEMDLPWPIPNLEYVTDNTVSRFEIEGKEGYVLSWEQVRSTGTRASKGRVRFFPYQGKTLAVYTNWVDPDSIFATLLRKRFMNDVQTSFKAILGHLVFVKNHQQEHLHVAKERILSMLKGDWVYQNRPK